jgi:hypothetical protein
MIAAISEVYIYFASNKGYEPAQPVEFSHKTHAEKFGIKCMFCHYGAESSQHSNIPTTYECMVCHIALNTESELLKPVNYSYYEELPIKWNKVFNLPDYAKFDHEIHVKWPMDCSSCHGEIESKDKVRRNRIMSMQWCLQCHRNPESYVVKPRFISGIIDTNIFINDLSPIKIERKFRIGSGVCSGCHY